MFEVSHRLIGIYKVANATKSEYPLFPSCGGFAVLKVWVIGVSIDNFALNAPALPPAPASGSHGGPPSSTIRPAGSVRFASTAKPRSTSVRA